jgi:hypothetical protein
LDGNPVFFVISGSSHGGREAEDNTTINKEADFNHISQTNIQHAPTIQRIMERSRQTNLPYTGARQIENPRLKPRVKNRRVGREGCKGWVY